VRRGNAGDTLETKERRTGFRQSACDRSTILAGARFSNRANRYTLEPLHRRGFLSSRPNLFGSRVVIRAGDELHYLLRAEGVDRMAERAFATADGALRKM
jgi:hypothetical protein